MNPSVENQLLCYDNKLSKSTVTNTERIEDFGLLVDSKLHFHIMLITY